MSDSNSFNEVIFSSYNKLIQQDRLLIYIFLLFSNVDILPVT